MLSTLRRAALALLCLLVLLPGAPAGAGDPLGPQALAIVTLLTEDVAKDRPGARRRELEDDLRAAYLEYALLRQSLGADHAAALAHLADFANDPAAPAVLAARAERFPAGSPYAHAGESWYLGLRAFYAAPEQLARWRRIEATFARAYQGR